MEGREGVSMLTGCLSAVKEDSREDTDPGTAAAAEKLVSRLCSTLAPSAKQKQIELILQN